MCLPPSTLHACCHVNPMAADHAQEESKKTSTSIRLHDADLSLVLAIKEEGEEMWSHYSKSALRERVLAQEFPVVPEEGENVRKSGKL